MKANCWFPATCLFFFAPALFAQSAPELNLTITGDVATPLQLTLADLAGMAREKISVDQGDGKAVVYEGVLLSEVLKKAGVPTGGGMRGKALASYLLAEAADDYQVAFSLPELDPEVGSTRVLIADKSDTKPLPDSQGPLRLVVPTDRVGARSVRKLVKIEVVRLRQ